MEEINEIIARSQTRAQQLLASGAYDDPQSLLSPIRDLRSPNPDYLSPRPNTTNDFNSPLNGSLDTTYQNKMH